MSFLILGVCVCVCVSVRHPELRLLHLWIFIFFDPPCLRAVCGSSIFVEFEKFESKNKVLRGLNAALEAANIRDKVS